MPLVGLMDIGLGVLILIFPMRVVLLHMTIWEFVERAGSYGAPIALFILMTLQKRFPAPSSKKTKAMRQ